MTAEGVFPKIAGDIAYASEANRFAGAGRFIKAGSTNYVPSGTGVAAGYSDAGSFIISGGTLSNPAMLNFHFTTLKAGAGNAAFEFRLSGNTTNRVIVNDSFAVGQVYGNVSCLIGSPFWGSMNMIGKNTGTDDTAAYHTVNTIDNLDVGSPIIVLLRTKINGAGSVLVSYAMSAEGVGY